MCSNLAKTPGLPLLASKMGSFPRGLALPQPSSPCSIKRAAGARVAVAGQSRSSPIRVWTYRNWAGLRNYSSSPDREAGGGDGGGRVDGGKLPWIAAYNGRKVKVSGETSSWEESASRYFVKKSEGSTVSRRGESEGSTVSRKGESEFRDSGKNSPGEDAEEADEEPAQDPRWDRIRSRYDRFVRRDSGYGGPEAARWSRQEEWGRRTMREATASSVPKMSGEAVYGVGSVLAALTAGRREFYALYVQEGLDLIGLSRKKKRKDRKGIGKIFRLADELSLTIKEASKHDLNMVVDNRPHQGLILDASPLEMVGIKEMDPVSLDVGDKAPVWVALDEVTDPQNLGAIVRSCYFFGVRGVVVCAKNSAPLSGVVSKASAGSLELIELRSCKNMMNFLSASVENGWRVLGGSVSPKAQSLAEVSPGTPTILVLGSEGSGLRPLVERSCTQLVKIPGGIPPEVDAYPEEYDPIEGELKERDCSEDVVKPFVAVESLNVSVAAGVLLYHLTGNSLVVEG